MIMTSTRPELRRVIRALQKQFKRDPVKRAALIARAKELHREKRI